MNGEDNSHRADGDQKIVSLPTPGGGRSDLDAHFDLQESYLSDPPPNYESSITPRYERYPRPQVNRDATTLERQPLSDSLPIQAPTQVTWRRKATFCIFCMTFIALIAGVATVSYQSGMK